MLIVSNLECARGDRTLFSQLNFQVEPEDLLLVHGQNGSGKTTLLRTLCGLVLPVMGEVYWQGNEIRKFGEDYFKDLLYLGHHAALKEEFSALENLRTTLKLAGHPVADDAIDGALAKMGLAGREDLPTKVLSQGQKRRVALARLLLSRAKLWILDEPFTALDVKAVAYLQTVISEHLHQGGLVILTTHQVAEIPAPNVRHIHL